MKLSNRAKSALATAGYSTDEQSAIAQLAAFAAQNSGIEPRNYYDPFDIRNGRREAYFQGRRAFAQEVRSITADWKRFRHALIQAAIDGVTDADVIREAPHAYSGRLEWVSVDYLRRKHGLNTDYTPGWNYCTGQYFPTEYRKAAACLLETAARLRRADRPAEMRSPVSIQDLKELNRKNGGCWFDQDSMRFFGTRICGGIRFGRFFITSEQPPHGSRRWSIRSFGKTGRIDTVGSFCAYLSLAQAEAALETLTAAQTTVAA